MPRFKILRVTTADGRVFVGAIHGQGGLIAAESPRNRQQQLERLAVCASRAAAGEPLNIYEPQPGCCKLYPHAGAPLAVPLAGARFEWADEADGDRR